MITRRLIEEELPLDAVNAASAREKSLRHGHISTMHLWWAPRPLAMCRAIVFGTLLPDPGNDARRNEILDLVAQASQFEPVTTPVASIPCENSWLRPIQPVPPKYLTVLRAVGPFPSRHSDLAAKRLR